MKAVNVEIMGLSLTVASEDGDEWVKNLAQTVDDRIRQIQAGGRTVNSINLAILAALNFADELERLRRDHQELIERIEALNGRLSDAMEE
jgi:cell division protein ZapA